jgi:hypothetical protein
MRTTDLRFSDGSPLLGSHILRSQQIAGVILERPWPRGGHWAPRAYRANRHCHTVNLGTHLRHCLGLSTLDGLRTEGRTQAFCYVHIVRWGS